MNSGRRSVLDPLLLLDIDGVVCPMGPGCGEELLELQGPDYPVWISAGTPLRLRELAEVFTLVWATNWEGEANRFLAPALSLPPLTYIPFSQLPGRRGHSYKLRAVQGFAESSALAWLDDEVGEDMVAWATKRRVPTLIRSIDPRVGMDDGDVDALLEFFHKGTK